MKVREVMRTPVITVSAGTTYEETARILHAHGVSGAPVLDAEGRLAGIVSEKDLFRAMFPRYEDYLHEPEAYHDQEDREDEIEALRREPVEKFMTQHVITVNANACILRAGGLMLAHGLHRLPVTENGGTLAGIVTREDIYGTILKKHLGWS